MDNNSSPDKTLPIQFVRSSRAFKQFKNPPQPHMCIQDTIKNSSEKLYINVLGWQKIANPKQYSDPIPLYGGMQVPQGCGPKRDKPPLIVFAVMVNPEILKANGKNAANPMDRDALVSLLCDFVEAMNPGLYLTRSPVILTDRDLTGELKDVWLAVQSKREREKGQSQDVLYKVYDIDGIGEDPEDNRIPTTETNSSYNHSENERKQVVKSSKQILLNAGQKSEFDSGMNNYQLNQITTNNTNSGSSVSGGSTYCTPVYGQIVSTRENHIEADRHCKIENLQPVFRNKTDQLKTSGWDEFSKRDISTINKNGSGETKRHKNRDKARKNELPCNAKESYDFFPIFETRTPISESDIKDIRDTNDTIKTVRTDEKIDESKIIVDEMRKLVLHSTDNKTCDSNMGEISSVSS